MDLAFLITGYDSLPSILMTTVHYSNNHPVSHLLPSILMMIVAQATYNTQHSHALSLSGEPLVPTAFQALITPCACAAGG
jgi:hypothetical protein